MKKNYARCNGKNLGTLVLGLFFATTLFAQEKITYLNEPFETNLDAWTQTLASGSLEIVDNIDGDGKVVKLTSVNAEQTFMSINLPESTPNGEEYFIEYDYRTENTANGYSGKMANHALFPSLENSTVALIGGPGNEFYTASTDQNFALQADSEITAHEAGRWRMEISPSATKATDRFLNVMQVMDAGTTELTVVKILIF